MYEAILHILNSIMYFSFHVLSELVSSSKIIRKNISKNIGGRKQLMSFKNVRLFHSFINCTFNLSVYLFTLIISLSRILSDRLIKLI